MEVITASVCTYENFNDCKIINRSTSEIMELVIDNYFDLQMYANFVYDVENEKQPLSESNNLTLNIDKVKEIYQSKYPNNKIFDKKRMQRMAGVVLRIMQETYSIVIDGNLYRHSLENIKLYGAGNASVSIFLEADKINKQGEKIRIIIKLFPLQFPHQYIHFPTNLLNMEYVVENIEAPSYALFYKEAWMYCFTSIYLQKYSPTYNCVADCKILNGIPFASVDELKDIYKEYTAHHKIPHKKWLEILVSDDDDENNNEDLPYETLVKNCKYGCFEMAEIDGTIMQLIKKNEKIDLGIIFEYLYSKLVAAYIGRIIFTDDHLDNVGYINVKKHRHYEITCNGCVYHFWIKNQFLVQMIDMERYIFNFSQYDIFSNHLLKYIPESEYKKSDKLPSNIFVQHRINYLENNYIYDKGVESILEHLDSIQIDEKDLVEKILKDPFTFDVKLFCQNMQTYLPESYITPPEDDIQVLHYKINLDEDPRIITRQMIIDEMID